MPEGWLLDITDSRPGTGVVLWMKERSTGRVDTRRVPFRPPFLVDGPSALLDEVARTFSNDPGVEAIERRTERPSLFDRRARRVLAVTARRNFARRRLASAIDALGGYRALTLYDVDLGAPQLYHLSNGLYPFAPIVWDGAGVRATEPPETIDYAPVPIRWVPIGVRFSGVRPGGIVPPGTPVRSVRVGAVEVEAESEAATLHALVGELSVQDPDLLLSEGGDALDLPRLFERAVALGLDEEAFFLGREPAAFRPIRPASSYESYGRIYHRDTAFAIPGRFHVDGRDSFLFGDASIEGMVDAARLSRLSLQSVARQSPGTCFTAMEMAHALTGGVHIPWKKNRPEEFKPLDRLLEADRGGVIFVPPVGVFGGVDEFDFSSLYPHIMVRNNLSTETLDCRCCPGSPHRAPGLGYRSCTKRPGLIPRTLAPLIARRLAYKTRLKDPAISEADRDRYTRRTKMLKWILVTSFGYQGYRNARFGRIECHEAINAYARELIARLIPRSESEGYRVLHGIVDSLWLSPADPADPPDPERFAERMSAEFDLPLGHEGRYRWIVFLPSVGTGLGVPNRYYGLYGSGEFKLRGVRSRRGDTPVLLEVAERAVLERFAEERDPDGVRGAVPEAVERLDAIAARVREGAWPIGELVLTHRVGQDPSAYSVFTESVAALRQLAELGVERSAGQSVRYVIKDRASRSFRERVTVAERLSEGDRYDPIAYVELLARGADTLLAPLGFPYAKLCERWDVGRPVARPGPRSPEQRAQRTL
ncbi:MAG TPA: DNA polymerase domain-containing protein [Thermoplasmata archaeon]|nr:DNA polymerase domain-containing protein [Thermoplasmata archaeon]